MNTLKKPKIAIVIDKEGWAFDNTANEINNNLSNYYDIDIIPMDIFGGNVIKLLLINENYDLMFIMWRGIISWLYSDFSREYIKKLGFEYDNFLQKFVKEKNIITGVYDHLFLDKEEERTKFILENVKDYVVSSKKLYDIYNKKYDKIKKPSAIASDGVNLKLFKMYNKNKYNEINDRIIKLGWTGNSKFTDDADDDLKGVNRIIKPAITELIQEGYNIELNVADRNVKMIPHNEMVNYYNDIDIYICTSRTEGHPAPVLESMACGLPIISTDVGIVSEAFGEKQRRFIIDRNKDNLKQKIIELITNKELLLELSNENTEQIKNWSWENKCKEYKEFFDRNL